MGERSGVLALAALAPSAMLALDPLGWYPFGPAKWLAVSLLLPLGAALVLRDRTVRIPAGLGLALGALVAWLAVAALLGEDPLYAWIGTPERHFGMLTWALCALALAVGCSLEADRDTAPIMTGLVVAGLGVGGVATIEALGWEPDLLDVGSRLTGTFGSSAYLGAATALLLPIALGQLLQRSGTRARRWVAGVTTVLLAVACLGSGARAAWLGLAVAGAATAWARRSWIASQCRARAKHAVGAVVGLAVVSALVLVLSPVGGRLGALGDDEAPGGQGRLDEWRVAVDVASSHPLVGVGPEGYRVAFHEGADADYERAHGRERQPDRAHSGPLDLLLAGGIGALAAWAAVAALVGRSVWCALRDGPAWLVGLAAALIAHVAGQLVLFPIVELEPLVWLLAGLVVVHAPARRPSAARSVPALATGALGLLAVVALGAGVTDLVADRRADVAAEALARGDNDAAAAAALDAADLRPDIVRLHLLAAAALVADEQGTLAGLHEVEAALDVSPGDPIVLLARVRLLAERAVATGVERHIEQAIDEVEHRLDEDPHNAQLWRVDLALRQLVGDADAEARAADRLRDLDPPDSADR